MSELARKSQNSQSQQTRWAPGAAERISQTTGSNLKWTPAAASPSLSGASADNIRFSLGKVLKKVPTNCADAITLKSFSRATHEMTI